MADMPLCAAVYVILPVASPVHDGSPVPQDRKSTFEPRVARKRQKDIFDIDQKIISMYAKDMTTRQISETIEDIYGFGTSEGFISDVTDQILPQT